MSKKYLIFLVLLPMMIEFLNAKSIVDCRIIVRGTTECNPYPSKRIRAKEIRYDIDRKKLIISKTLPVPRKATMKVVSVVDMIEKYIKIEKPIRFCKSEKLSSKVLLLPKVEEKKIVVSTISQESKKEVEKKKTIEVLVPSQKPKKEIEKSQPIYGKYIVVKGDMLSRLANKLGIKMKDLRKLNHFKNRSVLYVGETLKIPFTQKKIDALLSAKYEVEDGDTLISIAQIFGLESKAIMKFNSIENEVEISKGKIISLPLPYILAKQKRKKKKYLLRKKSSRVKFMQGFGQRKLRVTATAYSSDVAQTDSTPFLAAWNNRLRPGMKIIAVSRDLLSIYGMRNGTRVRIGGLPGFYRVRDKMNKRYRKRIDIYTGIDRRKALRWGRRNVVIYW